MVVPRMVKVLALKMAVQLVLEVLVKSPRLAMSAVPAMNIARAPRTAVLHVYPVIPEPVKSAGQPLPATSLVPRTANALVPKMDA